MIQFPIKTYKCDGCGSRCDYEPTAFNHARFVTSHRGQKMNLTQLLKGMPDDLCTDCFLGTELCKNSSPHECKVKITKNPEHQIIVSIIDENDIDQMADISESGKESLKEQSRSEVNRLSQLKYTEE